MAGAVGAPNDSTIFTGTGGSRCFLGRHSIVTDAAITSLIGHLLATATNSTLPVATRQNPVVPGVTVSRFHATAVVLHLAQCALLFLGRELVVSPQPGTHKTRATSAKSGIQSRMPQVQE